MPTGSFNVQRLTAELGLKNVIEMPVGLSMQAVIPLETMAGMVPVHQSPQAMFGGLAQAFAAEHSTVEISSLDPGGVYLEYFQQSGGVPTTVSVRTGQNPVIYSGVGPIVNPPQDFQTDGVLSTVTHGTVVAAPLANTPELLLGTLALVHPIWLERGQRIVISALTANAAFRFNLVLMAIVATQAEE